MYYMDVEGPASITYVAYAWNGDGWFQSKILNNNSILLTHTPEKLDKGSNSNCTILTNFESSTKADPYGEASVTPVVRKVPDQSPRKTI